MGLTEADLVALSQWRIVADDLMTSGHTPAAVWDALVAQRLDQANATVVVREALSAREGMGRRRQQQKELEALEREFVRQRARAREGSWEVFFGAFLLVMGLGGVVCTARANLPPFTPIPGAIGLWMILRGMRRRRGQG